MNAEQMNELWNLTRENEKTIAVLSTRFDSQSAEIQKLREDNEAMRALLNRAIGERTAVGIIGAIVLNIITWAVTYFTAKGAN